MLVTLKMILRTLILPPAGPLIAVLAGLWLRRAPAGERARKTGSALVAVGLGSLWLLSTPVIADRIEQLAQRVPPLSLATAPDAQAIVILGGGSERWRAPEYGNEPAAEGKLLERLTYGAFLARRTQLPVAVTGTLVEATAMRATLARDFGIPVRWFEASSHDTFENAALTAQLLKPQGITRILLVTDAAHEWRAAHEFTAAGFTVAPAPVGIHVAPAPAAVRYLPSIAALGRSTEALYELLGDLARRVFAATDVRRQGP
ncbi:MAG TPA: YdcF family protein [Steroidobacteraceae bacterium]|nr:YdcF family protein [Steroidobacteraceae bacterium]